MLIDQRRLQQITHNNPELLAKIAELTLTELPVLQDSVTLSVELGEREGIAKSVHRLKSALSNLVGPEFYREIADLESLIEETDLNIWTSQWHHAEQKLGILENEIRALLTTAR